LSPEADRALEAYRWPGNLRELRHAVERAVILGLPPKLELHELPEAVRMGSALPVDVAVESSLEAMERAQIARVLASGVGQEEAAELLGISTATLWRKRKEYKLA
jgi:NtrC-family two-component system response regulator AlgB